MFDLILKTPNNGQFSPDDKQEFIFLEGTNDVQINSNNDLMTLDGTDRLSQDICKILITERGTNLQLPIYGSNLQSLIGQKMELSYLQGQVLSEVRDSLIILQALNQTNPDLDQQIQTLQSIQVDITTPTQITIQFVIITKSGKQVGSIVTIV